MTENKLRIITGAVLGLGAIGAVVLEYFGIPAVRWVTVAIAAAALVEWTLVLFNIKSKKDGDKKAKLPSWQKWMGWCGIAYFLIAFGPAAYFVGGRPWIMLLILLIISFADIGAFIFGRMIGGDKMWERLSAGKTWAGQIAGIACGTFAAVMYGLLGTDTFLPQLMWIGISVSLLSQYGDLTASWVKRKIGIKDFGNTLPGHGGVLDRFDGWIYVLPIIWLVML